MKLTSHHEYAKAPQERGGLVAVRFFLYFCILAVLAILVSPAVAGIALVILVLVGLMRGPRRPIA